MKINLSSGDEFSKRHIGPDANEQEKMLEAIGVSSLNELISQTIPQNIRLDSDLNLPDPLSESKFLKRFKKAISQNKVFNSFQGQGYYGCKTPTVIQRNILENPGWYTAYTPYQAEIAQGRLEALINFQTMVTDLTGMELANASLLDEGTAAAEAMSMLFHSLKGEKKSAKTFLVDEDTFAQTVDILKTRAVPLGINLLIKNVLKEDLTNPDVFGVLLQHPDSDGQINDISDIISACKTHNIYTAVATDLLSLTLIKSPGEMGADVVVGSSQRMGVPMGFGGPHAAFFATHEEFKRQIPGRIIGVSVDKNGDPAYRMALQTREQHIKRERATSNICTAQVLLAVMAGMYAVYHGPKGLKNIAIKINYLAQELEKHLKGIGFNQLNTSFFDTIKIDARGLNNEIKKISEEHELNFWYHSDGTIGITIDETHDYGDVLAIAKVFAEADGSKTDFSNEASGEWNPKFSASLIRTSAYLQHPVFNSYHSEHEMLRYLKRLENKDLSLVHSMISLGSCTMKLNATTEMIPVTWDEISQIHPFAPEEQTQGYRKIISELKSWLTEITGFAGTSLQPNSGAQGEFAGLMVIKRYLEEKGEGERNITLIPSSAHGTNPASAVMAGMQVIIVKCDEKGNIDVDDLLEKAELHKERLAALMVTYPSTHGVFEERIIEICQIIHDHGGQVYMDGANMNAQVGLTSPAKIGADVCHLNLHKTFCIPHGGGGPGVGPICVTQHLKEFLPGNPYVNSGGKHAIHAISSALWGSASILAISYAYIAMMGTKGLKRATEIAILNANYILSRLKGQYEILYTGAKGRCGHEMIVDCRPFKKTGVEVEDIAKRLMDYGFHAPTISFPVPGTMMVEPTESESKEEIDRFCDALIAIRKEISEIENGLYPPDNNVLKNAPHTQMVVISDKWPYPYSVEKAVFPLPFVKSNKFWPAVGRIDAAYGDRNLYCSCIPVEEYEKEVTVSD